MTYKYTLACQGNVSVVETNLYTELNISSNIHEQSMASVTLAVNYLTLTLHKKRGAFHFPESSLLYLSLHYWHLPVPLTNVLESHLLLGIQSRQ